MPEEDYKKKYEELARATIKMCESLCETEKCPHLTGDDLCPIYQKHLKQFDDKWIK
jgi:hypothetical protein